MTQRAATQADVRLNRGARNASGRQLSASNIAAASASGLSIARATNYRKYTVMHLNGRQSRVKEEINQLARVYYQQLTLGCGSKTCTNAFCISGSSNKVALLQQSPTVLAMYLATLSRKFICLHHKNPQPLPPPIPRPQGILAKLLSSSVFSFLYTPTSQSSDLKQPLISDAPFVPDHEVLDEDVEDYAMTHLSLPTLKRAVDLCQGCNDFAFLDNTIHAVYASAHALSRSFIDARGGLNVDECLECYGELLKIPDPQSSMIISALAQATCSGAASLLHHHSDDDDVIVIHALQSLLQNPLLVQADIILPNVLANVESCCSYLAQFLVQMSPQRVTLFKHAIEAYSAAAFLRLVAVFHTHLTRIFRANMRPEHNITLILDSLQLLFYINEEFPKIPISSFYNNALVAAINKHEFQFWSHNLKSGNRSERSWLEWPLVLDAWVKVQVLHVDAYQQMSLQFQHTVVAQAWIQQAQKLFDDSDSIGMRSNKAVPYLMLEIRRDYVIQDTMSQLRLRMHDLKKPLKFTFAGEQGLDLGGVQKEFFQLVTQELLSPTSTMFLFNKETQNYWINGESEATSQQFEMAGIIIGLAIYNGVILDIHFPRVLYKKLQGIPLTWRDFIDLEPTVYRSHDQILEMPGNEVEDLMNYFLVDTITPAGTYATHELVPNGGDILVTGDNRAEFVNAYAMFLMTTHVSKQFDAFSRGFQMVCGGAAITLFHAEELELLVCGSPEFDFAELQQAAQYADGYTATTPVCVWLWEILNEMDDKSKRAFLHFVTASSRTPIRGLGKVIITIQRHSPDSDRLPSAMTCFSRLLLPEYSDRAKLQRLLTIALDNAHGFGNM